MPSRWVSGYQDILFRFRNSPGAIAATAGGIGLLCGGALVVATTSGPSASTSHVAHKPPVETTGIATPLKVEAVQPPAPVKTDTASVSDCAHQTWPYITQQCLTEREAAQRKVRVITTDRIAPPVVSAIETERAKDTPRIKAAPVRKDQPTRETVNLAPAAPKPAVPAPAAVAAAHPTPALEAKAIPVVDRPAAVAAPAVSPMVAPAAAPVPVPAARPQMTVTNEQSPRAVANEIRTKNARDARDKRTRDARSRAPARDSDDDEAEDTRRTRIVERWTEREYDVPSEQGSQRRRVIVIRRSGDRSIFAPSARSYSRSAFQY